MNVMKRYGLFMLLVAMLLVVYARPALSIYKWVDDQGLLHITDNPPPSKAPEPAEAPEPAKAAPVLPATPPALPTPTAAQPISAPQTVTTKTSPAAATTPSVTAAVVAAPAASTAPAASPVRPSMPRQQAPLPAAGVMALAGGFMLIAVVIGLGLYIYYSLSMYLIAKRLNVTEAWMSWVPILNLWPLLSSAGKPCWWVILLLIPFVNIFIIVYLWMCICENLGRNKWLGLLTLVPVVNLILPGVLAFSKSE